MFDLSTLSLEGLRHALTSPLMLLLGAFQIWMGVHAIRAREWLWAAMIVLLPVAGPLFYYLQVYRASGSGMRGFELPGAHDRRRIKTLQAQIHNLDKPHHRLELGDIYFQQNKLAKAEACYRAAIERDPRDIHIRAHLGQCLLRQKRTAEALPLLEGVGREDPKHDYGHSLMALAEARAAEGDVPGAIAVWRQVTAGHAYARARVQLAELLAGQGQFAEARGLLEEVLNDALHGPAFARKRERVWVRRARARLRRLPAQA